MDRRAKIAVFAVLASTGCGWSGSFASAATIVVPAEVTYIRNDTSTNIDKNFAADVFGVVGTVASASATNELRTLFQFDPSTIPAGATITAVNFRTFNERDGSIVASLEPEVYALTRPFVETEATWNIAATGVPWTTPGGDFSTLLATGTINTATTGQEIALAETPAFTSYLQSFVGTSTPINLIMKGSAANEQRSDRNLVFVGSENAVDASVRPILEVTYVPEPGSLAVLGVAGLLLVRRRARV